MKDYIASAVTFDGQIRAYSAITTSVVKKAFHIHDTYPVATAAFGRVLTGSALMGAMLKGEKDILTIQVKGDGPLGGIVATANSNVDVKGYIQNPHVDLPLREDDGKLDVGGAVGKNGFINVVKDLGLKEPYTGNINLVSGEIAEDLTMYFAKSEQTPSVVALGVLVDSASIVKAAGGYIIQLMPNADNDTITKVEQSIASIPSPTQMISDGLNCEDILGQVLHGFPLKFIGRKDVSYRCDCNRDKVEKALISIGKKDIMEIIEQDGKAELTCHFCNEKYNYSLEDLQKILNS